MGYILRNPEVNADDIDLLGPAARIEILNQHPELNRVKAPWLEATFMPNGSARSISDWLAAQKELYGDKLSLVPMSIESLTYATITVLQNALQHPVAAPTLHL